MTNDLLTVWSDNAAVSLVIWGAIAITILYLGRKQAHQVFYSTGRALYRTMRLWGFSLAALEQRIAARNREVLLAHGTREAEKSIEREFSRISDIVQRDLSQYPALHRQIGDVIDKIEIDYQKATETAPLPPAWKEVVETITSIPASGDPAVNKILQHVKSAVEDSHLLTRDLDHVEADDVDPAEDPAQLRLRGGGVQARSENPRGRVVDDAGDPLDVADHVIVDHRFDAPPLLLRIAGEDLASVAADLGPADRRELEDRAARARHAGMVPEPWFGAPGGLRHV